MTNSGDLVTHGAALSYTPPAGITVLNSTPAAEVFGQRLQWRLGDLPPGTTSVVELNCRASVAASVRSAFLAMPRKLAPQISRVRSPEDAEALLRREVHAALNKLAAADYRPPGAG